MMASEATTFESSMAAVSYLFRRDASVSIAE